MNPSTNKPAEGKRGAGGFSALELLIVLAGLLILTVMTSNYLGVGGGDRTLANCQSNLQKIYLALNIYKNDNNGTFPFLKGAENPAAPLSLLIPKSTTVTEMFICPGSKDGPLPEAESFAHDKISYAYYMGRATNDSPDEIIASDAQVNAAPKDKGQPIFSADGRKPGNNHGKKGGNLLSLAGEVTRSGSAASRDYHYPAEVRLLNPQ